MVRAVAAFQKVAAPGSIRRILNSRGWHRMLLASRVPSGVSQPARMRTASPHGLLFSLRGGLGPGLGIQETGTRTLLGPQPANWHSLACAILWRSCCPKAPNKVGEGIDPTFQWKECE